MQAILDIPDEALGEMRSRSKTAGDIPIQAVVNWTPDGILSAHFISFVKIPEEENKAYAVKPARKPQKWSGLVKVKQEETDKTHGEPKPESLDEIRKRWPWAGIAAEGIRHDVSHDWADIQRSIEEGWAAEVAEKENRILAEYDCGSN